jgi:hypothetical protein
MSPTPRARGAAIAPLLYWLLVVGGLLTAHHVLERGAASSAGALWAGAVLGTAIGQGAAWRRISLWAVTLFVPVLMVAALQLGIVLSLAAGIGWHSADPWSDLEMGAMAFAPAVACGYASLSERGGLLAFWFPTSLWSLAILDGADGTALAGAWSWLLLSALAALFVALLAAREARRVALWQHHAAGRLSTPRAPAVLRRSPTRGLSQAAWAAVTVGATLALTAWIAPHLWQTENVASHGLAESTQATGGAGGAPCCPQPGDPEDEAHRLREYFPLLDPHEDHKTTAAEPCVSCAPGAAGGAGPVELSPLAAGDGDGAASQPSPAGAPPGQGDAAQALSSTAQQPPTSPAAPAPSPVPAPPPTPQVHASAPPVVIPPSRPAPAHAHPAPAVVTRGIEVHPLQGLLALVLSALLVQVALRPIRRMVTLRHLREALWAEPVDQRVSNLWQLVLVGLRDAGWHPAPGEQPLALARRAALPGMETCAMVLERTRHGARLDATDLEGMRGAAQTAYRAARQRIHRLARALSWLRWPLV